MTTPGRDPRFAGGFDLMAASEILYLDALHRPLVKFVDRHLAPGGKALFCTDMARAKVKSSDDKTTEVSVYSGIKHSF